MRPFSTPLGRWLGVLALAALFATPALAQRTVTLRMNSATLADTIKADTDLAGAEIRGQVTSGTALPDGNTIDWGSNTTLNPTNDGGDYWSIEFQIPDNEQLDFKFYFQQSEDAGLGGYEDGSNHVIAAGTGDVALDLHYFEKGDDKAYDWRPFAEATSDEINVWFRVYMLTADAFAEGRSYDRDNAALVVGARGNFGTLGGVDADGPIMDWGNGTDDEQIVALTRESGDSNRPGYDLYSGLVTYPASSAGMGAEYKFYFRDGDTTGDIGYEPADNRSFTLPAAGTDTTLHWVYYGDSPAVEPPNLVTREIAFGVNVSPVNDIGLFATSDDDILIRGTVVPMTGWNDCTGGDNPTDNCVLTRDPGTLDYFSAQNVTSTPGEVLEYKYFVDFNNPDGTPQFDDGVGNEIVLGWEEPLDFGGGNRRFAFTGNPEEVGPEFFNSIRPGNVISEGTSVDVTFSVFMGRATNADLFSRPFNPETDTVTVQFEDPLWLITQGYEAVDDRITVVDNNRLINGFKLTDPDGDMIYTGTLTVNGPTYNAIAYRYVFGDDTSLYSEGSGGEGAEGRRRYRYITDTSTGSFDFALDAFRRNGTEGDGAEDTPWEYNPTGTFSAENNPFEFANAIAVGADDPLGLAVANEGPVETSTLAIGRVRPNPTAGQARVQVDAPVGSFVTVRVFDVTGRMVRTVVEDAPVAGRMLDIDTQGLASGLYLVRAEAGGEFATTRFTVVR